MRVYSTLAQQAVDTHSKHAGRLLMTYVIVCHGTCESLNVSTDIRLPRSLPQSCGLAGSVLPDTRARTQRHVHTVTQSHVCVVGLYFLAHVLPNPSPPLFA
jgi:hypothetical protein